MAETMPVEPNWIRNAALEEIDNLKSIRATSWEQHSHSFKWLMASLLAVNGGAVLAIFDSAAITTESRLWAGSAFVVGIVAALLIAVFGQHSIQKALAPLQKYIGYWITVVEDGERDENLESDLNEELKRAAQVGVGARIAGWVSAIAFLAGVVSVGVGMKPDSSAAEMTQPVRSHDR